MQDNREATATAPIDVAAILEGLRADVRGRRQAQGHATQSPLERELQRSLDEIELYRVVSAHWPLLGTTLPQRVIALFNKLVRRYLRWYINPIVEQQNAANAIFTTTLVRLIALDSARRAAVASYRAGRAFAARRDGEHSGSTVE